MQDSDRSDGSRQPGSDSSQAGDARSSGARGRRTASSGFGKLGQFVKWTFITLFCLFSAGIGAVSGNFYWHSKSVRDIINGMMTPGGMVNVLKGDPLANYTPDQQFTGSQLRTLNILVLGCDSDYYDTHPDVIKGTPGRSDAIMMAHVDFEKNTLQVLSIPRDTAVPIPGYRGFKKVNAAHAFGGNALSATTIKQDFGIAADYTVSLDFDSFQKVVDAVGGVDLMVDKKLDYDDHWAHLYIHLKPGFQHLNGYHAMGFVRIRHSDDDLHRAERQHEFIEALRQKVTSPSSILKLPGVINAMTDGLKSDLSEGQMLALVRWASQLPKTSVQLETLPSSEDRKYVYADPVRSVAVISRIFFGGDPNAVALNVASRAQLAMSGRSYYERRHGHRVRRHGRAGSSVSRGSASTPPDGSAPQDSAGMNAPDGSTPEVSPAPTSPGDGQNAPPPADNRPPGAAPSPPGSSPGGTGDNQQGSRGIDARLTRVV